MNENRMVMTVREVQEELHIGRNKAYLLFKQPSFPSFMLDGTYLVARKDFETWLDRLKKLPGKKYVLDNGNKH
jgi:hypothetical protein